MNLINREFALGENVHHFPTNIAGGAYDCNFVTHFLSFNP
jgi:hypothetical protein